MTAFPRERSDKPDDPPHSGGEDEAPDTGQRDPNRGGKEPPSPGSGQKEERFPRKGEH
jgi:hypothetical protein